MSQTKIEWAEHVWNPVTGCTPVGAGCDNCYAERQSKRFGRTGTFAGPSRDFSRILFHPGRLDKPLKRKKPTHYFVCSMGDLFHEDVKNHWIQQVADVIFQCPQHTFTILTKRPERARHWFSDKVEPFENVRLYVSVWDQDSADEFIPILLNTPAAVRGVCIEPMLGPVDLVGEYRLWLGEEHSADCGGCSSSPVRGLPYCPGHEAGGIDHVILGGETGPGAREMPIWGAMEVKNQCVTAGVPFFYKGIGTALLPKKSPSYMLLDGRTWEEMP